jgi:hypothetical protein
MGLLYTTEATRNILDTLNTAFDGPNPTAPPNSGLQYIRDQVEASRTSTDPRLYNMVNNPPWKRGHLATTLQLFPYNQKTGGMANPGDKGRWAFFLKSVVGPSFGDLCKALSDAILKKAAVNIIQVSFHHVEKTGSPNLVYYDAPLTPSPSGPYARQITLFTRNLIVGESATFDTPDPSDGPPFNNPGWQKP